VNARRRFRLALASRQLVVVTGKGGVGKTVLSAALGTLLAAEGRRVLILESDPRENLHHLFHVPPSGGEVVEAAPGLQLRNASPRAVLDAVVRQKLKIGAIAKRVLGSPIYQHFAEGAPGLKEMMLLGHAMLVAEGEEDVRADVVVLDAPATGHGLSLLAAPLLVSEVIGTGPLGVMATRLARWIADPQRTAMVLAALPEEMPIQEALETIALLRERVGRPPELVVLNGRLPPCPAGRAPPGADPEAVAMWRARSAVQLVEADRLRAAWHGPLAELPLLPLPFGPDLVPALADALRPQLEADGA
jgi:anion-transporting  ArsA/GET3 family ATPase